MKSKVKTFSVSMFLILSVFIAACGSGITSTSAVGGSTQSDTQGSASETTTETTTTTTNTNPASAPTNVSGSANSNQLTITWNAAANAVSYLVYFSQTTGVSATQYDGKQSVEGATTITLTGMGYGTYYFVVTAVGTDGTESDPSAEASTTLGCVSSHDAEGTVVWTYSNCGSGDTISVNQLTVGDDGNVLGSRSVSKGRASFKMTGLRNNMFGDRDVFVVFMDAFGNNGREVNWHWHAYGSGGGIQSRLTAQRFDGTCSPFCETKHITNAIQFTDASLVFQWECGWDTTVNNVWCEVYNEAGGLIERLSTTPKGPYNSLNYFGIGKGAYQGPGYPQVPATVSNLRFSVLQ